MEAEPLTAKPKRRLLIAIAAWLLVIAIAAALDSRVALAARASGIEEFIADHPTLKAIFKAPGFYPTTIAIAVLVYLAHPLRWRGAAFVLIATATSGVQAIIKWMAGRYRPFKPPDGSGRLVPFEIHPFPASGRNLCFPSGHACLAFAT